MQPLKILAIVTGAIPIATFVVTLILTDGAPLRPLTPGQESDPAAATPETPRGDVVRRDGIAAAGHKKRLEYSLDEATAMMAIPLDAYTEPATESVHVVNAERDAGVYITLFGVPNPYWPPAP